MSAPITPSKAIPAEVNSGSPGNTKSRFERLPLLVSDQISELLAAKKRDICAFGLASRYCAYVSRRHRLARLQLSVTKRLPRRLLDLRLVLEPSIVAQDGCFRYVRHLTITKVDSSHRPKSIKERDNLWLDLAKCIQEMPCLADLVYSCQFPLPACLLRALQKKQSFTRLHITGFSIKSLLQSRDSVGLGTEYGIGSTWSITEAMMNGVLPQGGAPKENDLNPNYKAHSVRLYCRRGSEYNLEDWAFVGHLRELTALDIRIAMIDTVRSLTELARHNAFQGLQNLSLGLFPRIEPQYGILSVVEMEQETSALMRLRPLQVLALRNFGGQAVLKAVLDKHGKTVTKLHLYALELLTDIAPYVLSSYDVACIGRQCPHLEHLGICIRRTHGNHAELGIYQALGQVPNLRSISLHMECAYLLLKMTPGQDTSSPDIFRGALGNCAIDAQLTLAIFKAITANGHSKLDDLKIYGDYLVNRHPPTSDYIKVLKWVAQSWVCEKDFTGRMRLWRIPSGQRSRSFQTHCRILENDFHGEQGFQEDIKAAWTSLWPGEGPDWREQWASLPLSQVEHGTKT